MTVPFRGTPLDLATAASTADSDKGAKRRKNEGVHHGSIFREMAEVGLWGMPIFLFFSTFVFQNFKIPTQSMENTLLVGDHLTVNTYLFGRGNGWLSWMLPGRDPRRGDVVVFKYPYMPQQKWVKRLIGLPGEHFQIANDVVYIDGEVMDEGYALYRSLDRTRSSDRDPESGYRPKDYYTLRPGLENAHFLPGQNVTIGRLVKTTRANLKEFYGDAPSASLENMIARLDAAPSGVIPEGFYLMMGDNRNNSLDCRSWGLLPRELIEGRAYWVWWSYGEDLNTHELAGWRFLAVYARYPFTLWTRTHWSDCFKRIR